MDLKEKSAEYLAVVTQHLVETRLYQYVPSTSTPRTLELLEDHAFGLGSNEELGSWQLRFNPNDSTAQLQIFDAENRLLAVMALDRQGVWRGRDRRTKGTILLRPMTKKNVLWPHMLNAREWFRYVKSKGNESAEGFSYQEQLPPQLDWSPFEFNLAENIDRERLIDAKTAIALVAYDRPNYFYQMVQSLALNPEAKDLPVFVFLDRPREKKRLEVLQQQSEMAREAFPQCTIIKRPVNFGCGRNIIDVRRQMFDHMGYQRLFLMEDDLIVSPHYLGLCARLLAWAHKRWSNVGAVQCWNKCLLNDEKKNRRLAQVTYNSTNWWAYLQTRASWDLIKDNLYEYEKLFLGGVYGKRPHKSIIKWFREKLHGKAKPLGDNPVPEDDGANRALQGYFNSPPTGQDAATMVCFHAAGLRRLNTVVNRGEYVGKHGIHMNPRVYKQQGFPKMTHEVYDIDEMLDSFELHGKVEDPEPEEPVESPVEGMEHIVHE